MRFPLILSSFLAPAISGFSIPDMDMNKFDGLISRQFWRLVG